MICPVDGLLKTSFACAEEVLINLFSEERGCSHPVWHYECGLGWDDMGVGTKAALTI